MFWIRRFTVLLSFLVFISFTLWLVPRMLDPSKTGPERRARDRVWVNSSPYFLDRQVCRWMGLCGLHHLRRDPATRGNGWDDGDDEDEWRDLKRRAIRWEADEEPKEDRKRNVNDRRRILKDIPDYVTKHAPLVHLYSGEEFWPSDIKEHVEHMDVIIDGELLNTTDKWTLDKLHHLNKYEGDIVLESNENVEERPGWLHSHHNLPRPFPEGELGDEIVPPPYHGPKNPEQRESTTWYDVNKKRPVHRISDPRQRKFQKAYEKETKTRERIASRGHKPDENGYSSAPAVLIVVDKGSGIVDAFWFFFYSYNLGQQVLGIRFGNHVGDWEHTMIRFEHGVPRGVFFSEHEGGQAYAFEAVEKRGDRPVIYSAVGSHAMYALPGAHAYVLPFSLLRDLTDKGPVWDPALNNYAYFYDYTKEYHEDTDALREPKSLVPAASNPHAPTSWFHYRGSWGDDVYSLADQRQWRFFGQYHYVAGPDGPKNKRLQRSKLCQTQNCKMLYEIDPEGTWY